MTLIKESFRVCGFMKHNISPTGDWIIQLSLLHSVLRGLIESNGRIVTYVYGDMELEEAKQLMQEVKDETEAEDDAIDDEDVELNEIEQMESDLHEPASNQLTEREYINLNNPTNDHHDLDYNNNVSSSQPMVSNQLANNRWAIPAMQNMSLRSQRSTSHQNN